MSSDDDPPQVNVHPIPIPMPPTDKDDAKAFWQQAPPKIIPEEPTTTEPASLPSTGPTPTPPLPHAVSNGTNGTSGSGSSMASGKPRPSRWTKARSTSTESSFSLSGMTTLGSMYNQDGFPNYPASSDEDRDMNGMVQLAADDAAIAKQLALTDEAVRAINGTASVVQARNPPAFAPAPMAGQNTYELPRSMAAFVHRQPSEGGERELKTGRSFVSSGSSTSSEESEHLATVQWVKSVSQPNQGNSVNYPFYYTNPPAPATNNNMPPPATTGPRSPRRNGAGAAAGSNSPATPNPNPHFALPATTGNGAPAPPPPNEVDIADDDDDQTVGGAAREGSPSSSSASGLDLLSHAAAQHHGHRGHGHGQHKGYNSYIKRKAGAEAVAQWRESGIPTGASRVSDVRAGSGGYESPGYESTPSDGQTREKRERDAEPPKKRRKSEMQLEAPDTHLRESESMLSPEGSSHDSDYETDASDSEYHGVGGRRKSRGGNKGKNKMRVRATLPVAPPSASGSGKATPMPKKSAGGGGAGTKGARRMSESTDTKPNFANGVQCEYVNPLPPYQRCPDVFTRKYDIPRHMARHARREGDLVAEGKLQEDKALLWKTIRDKPRIRCKTCGEYFTRQDALKRHQTKQHHH